MRSKFILMDYHLYGHGSRFELSPAALSEETLSSRVLCFIYGYHRRFEGIGNKVLDRIIHGKTIFGPLPRPTAGFTHEPGLVFFCIRYDHF